MKMNKQKSLLYKKKVSFFFTSSLAIIHSLEKSLLDMDLVIFITSILSFVMTVMNEGGYLFNFSSSPRLQRMWKTR